MSVKMLVEHANQLVVVCDGRNKHLCGLESNHIKVFSAKDVGEGLSVAVGEDGCILVCGPDSVVRASVAPHLPTSTLDASGLCIIPGFVDSHTHALWAGDRANEFSMKLAGATYMDIYQAGGGIHYTMKCVRESSHQDLLEGLLARLQRMVNAGSTTIEVKTGYGADWDTELKMLRVLTEAKRRFSAADIVITFLPAHAIPKGRTAKEVVQEIVDHHLPSLSDLIASGEVEVDNIDVFCEKGIFEVPETACILSKAKELGLRINFHGDELNYVGAAELGARLGATAISHLEEISSEGIDAMVAAQVVAVLLPTTALELRLRPPPATDMISKGLPVALGSDFNPNAFCYSMPLVMHLACVLMRMTPSQAIVGASLNSAAALGVSDRVGSLEHGKLADMVILDVPSWEHIIYQLGTHGDLIRFVLKRGDIVYRKPL